MEKELIKQETEVTFDVNAEVFKSDLPDLSKAEASVLPVNGEYWTPTHEGETKRLFYVGLKEETFTNEKGEDVELPVAYFVEYKDGRKEVVRQAGRRLAGWFEGMANRVLPGTPFEITYLGKKKNNTNANITDRWSIKELIIR